ncbi:MAG: hypothetical protein FKY71_06090 [Spiribacter salinus]|uniref:Uncharacterized protein n=1 Tax=Spiribacter salinus TaxID=1335746 RepID=A0A540VT35_9GAMM|nr:MAG: hypothetical protein FKY71_06090 [Spiribacter salinus]
MADQPFISECYAGQDRQVTWTGVQMNDGDDFSQLLTTEVAARVHDEDGTLEFQAHLRGLATTGFQQESLQALLDAAPQEERDWAIGEALAEVHLSQEHGIEWPWNSERDKRTPLASLPGADLVGLMADDDGALLALGEVKCSSEEQNPPQVMYGRSGMANQLDRLADDLGILHTLLGWLFPRCKGTPHQDNFNHAVKRLLESDNKAIALFGILIRDTQPNTQDLCTRGRYLAGRLQAPTSCRLKALHLPCPINQLPVRITGGGS